MNSITDLLKEKADSYAKKSSSKNKEKERYITEEFQDYGLRLSHRLEDPAHKALYIKYARNVPRAILEDAAAFATDYPKAKNKGKIFMWKVKELLAEYRQKHPDYKFNKKRFKRTQKTKENLSFFDE